MRAWFGASGFKLRHRSHCRNIYHCTIQKAASQWMCGLLADERVHRYCGLNVHRPTTSTGPYTAGTIVSPLYIDYPSFAQLAKATPNTAFFVMRDPRDVLVSWYFSLKLSHPLTPEIEPIRGELLRLPEAEGLLYSLDFLHEYGLFAMQRSWAEAPSNDATVMLVRFEDLTGPDQAAVFERIFKHCDIRMPRAELEHLLTSHSFAALSGRQRGQEDPHSHHRKGIVGDWRSHFDAELELRFRQVAGDVLAAWKYE